MSTSFSKNVTLEINTSDAKSTWNLQIEDSNLTGSVSFTKAGEETIVIEGLGGGVQYQGGIYNGPFAIHVTTWEQNPYGASATMTIEDGWDSGAASFGIYHEGSSIYYAPFSDCKVTG